LTGVAEGEPEELAAPMSSGQSETCSAHKAEALSKSPEAKAALISGAIVLISDPPSGDIPPEVDDESGVFQRDATLEMRELGQETLLIEEAYAITDEEAQDTFAVDRVDIDELEADPGCMLRIIEREGVRNAPLAVKASPPPMSTVTVNRAPTLSW